MLTKRIIPCLDVKDGRVVKGINFVQLRDAGDPVETGEAYSKAGAYELVFLDITATSDARETVADMVRHVAERVFIRHLKDRDHGGRGGLGAAHREHLLRLRQGDAAPRIPDSP